MSIPPEALILIGAIVLLGVAPFLLAPRRDVLIFPRFWVIGAFLGLFAVRPFFILLDPIYAHPYLSRQAEFPRLVVGGLCMALAGLVAVWVGYFVRGGKRLSEVLPAFPQEISAVRWRQAVLGSFLLGLAAYLIFLRSMGGLKALLAVLYMRAAAYEADETAGPMKELAKLVGVAALLGIHYHLRFRRARWAWPLLGVSSVIIGTMGGRGAVAQLWVMTYLLYALARPRYRSWKFLGTLVLVVIVFAAGALGARRATSRGLGAAVESLRELPSALVENALDTVPMFDHMVAAMQAAGRDIPYREGSSYVQLIPIMVPRAIWPMETETVGVTVRKLVEPKGIGGRPPSAMGEAYLNFGVPGALAIMFLLGLWCRMLHCYLVRGADVSALVPLLYVFALFSALNFLSGVGPLAVRAFLFRIGAALVTFIWSARARTSSPVSPLAGPAPGPAAA